MKLNGQEFIIDNEINMKNFLEMHGFRIERIAVELNGDICPKSQFENVILKNDDTLEVVSFVGGG